MRKRINRLRGKIDRHGGFDILVTHAPMHGYGDLNDLPHRGFTASFTSCWTATIPS